MVPPERHYTAEAFESAGIGPFRDHARQYLSGERTIPVSVTTNHRIPESRETERQLLFTLSDTLLQQLVTSDAVDKPYSVALTFGYRGTSTGEQNGIFLLRKQDAGLITAATRLTAEHQEELERILELSEEDTIRSVKIVWHQPNGTRVVGAYNTRNNRIHFLDFAEY